MNIEAARSSTALAPYFLSSGWASPVYIDVQRLISFPRIRAAMMDLASQAVLARVGFEQFDTVAGVESSGIAYAAWIAERLSLPLQYVRRRPRGFGREAQIEGTLRPGARVLLVDDVSTDGRSKIELCRALRAMEARADHVLVMFFYDVFAEARSLLSELRIQLHHLASWRDILAEAGKSGFLPARGRRRAAFHANRRAGRWTTAHGAFRARVAMRSARAGPAREAATGGRAAPIILIRDHISAVCEVMMRNLSSTAHRSCCPERQRALPLAAADPEGTADGSATRLIWQNSRQRAAARTSVRQRAPAP